MTADEVDYENEDFEITFRGILAVKVRYKATGRVRTGSGLVASKLKRAILDGKEKDIAKILDILG